MKVTLWETQRKQIEVEVEFPLYRKHDLMADRSDTTIYMKVAEEGGRRIEYSVSVTHYEVERAEIEVDRDYHFDGSETDYLLGRGWYKSSPEEFEEAVAFAQRLLGEMVP